jgi:hypothetical protein
MAIVLSSCDKYDLKIISHPSYSIGLVGNYSPGGQTSAFILFRYDVNGHSLTQTYVNGDHHWNVPTSGVHIGEEYMVQYDSLYPGTARMLFSYQLADSSDFKKYVALFKKNPPGYPDP